MRLLGVRSRAVRKLRGLLLAGVCLLLVVLAVPGTAPASAAVAARSSAAGTGKPVTNLDAEPAAPGSLSPMDVTDGESASAEDAAAEAVKLARSTGRAVEVAALTTATTVTYAEPEGGFAVREDVLPQRVRVAGHWVNVSTVLRLVMGRLVPVAVPGDVVSFSAGGSGALAVISSGGSSLGLSWPGRLPVPAVSGASATYRDVLPGVDLVMTATSVESGGFREVLVVRSAAAARNPALRRLELRVTATGTRLTAGKDGSLLAVARRAGGFYSAAPPVMWDSSRALTSRALAAEARSAEAAGESVVSADEAVGAVSSAAGPGPGARVARIADAVTGGGSALSLVPAAAMLGASGVTYPEYLDPDVQWQASTGDEQAYDDVQSSCPDASHYDDPSYWSEGVGYEPDGCEGNSGTAYAYYQVAIKSVVHGGTVNAATVYAPVAYSGDCVTDADVTLSWTGAIHGSVATDGTGEGTDWDNKPGVTEDVRTADVKPDAESCNGSYDTNPDAWSGASWDVTSIGKRAAADHWSNFTFRLWEKDDGGSDTYWRRFTPDPYIWIQYTQAPDKPSGLGISTGGAVAGCLSSPYPWVGELSSGGTELSAVVSDKDGDELGGMYQYRTTTDSGAEWSGWTKLDDTAASVASGRRLQDELPYTVTNALTPETGHYSAVEWQVEAYNGTLYSVWSSVCEFKVEPDAPAPPSVDSDFTADPAPGSATEFTVTSDDPSSPAVKLAWGFDRVPSDTDPPSSHVEDFAYDSTTKTYATTADVSVTVPGPGPHALFVYVEDAAGAVSEWTTATFTAAGDSWPGYSSFTAALDADEPFDNELVSTSASDSGSADADGAGNSIPESELKAAGWAAGGTVTVDGATFTLPDYGTGSPDNILAANQTIDMSGEGTSLVFLVTATNADAEAPDPSSLPTADVSSPAITPDTAVAGFECSAYAAGLDDPDCTEPEGKLTYSSGTTADYYLSVPDWVSGDQGAAALELQGRATSSGSDTDPVNIYAISVPLSAADGELASVQLPDVGPEAAGAGIHVLGIAVADTTDATPGVSSSVASSAGPWTGVWESPSEYTSQNAVDSSSDGYDFDDTTIRIVTTISAGGSGLRLRLSNDLGWLSGDGPLDIGHVTVAEAGSGAAADGTPAEAVFTGSSSESVTIPEGGDVYSDPVDLEVSPGEKLDVSIWLKNDMPALVEDSMCSACTEYVAPDSSGDYAAAAAAAEFTASGSATGDYSNILTGIDTLASATPTAAVLGDGIIDGWAGSDAVSGIGYVSGTLAADLQADAGSGEEPSFAVTDAGIESNSLTLDGDGYFVGDYGGPSALHRLAHDILAEPGIGTVVIDEGLEDLLLSSVTASGLEDTYQELANQLQAWGINVIFATLTPCGGYDNTGLGDSCAVAAGTAGTDDDSCTAGTDTVDGYRYTLNCDLADGDVDSLATVDDFDDAVTVSENDSPETLRSADNAGDDVNLTAAGYAAVAATVTEGQLSANANS